MNRDPLELLREAHREPIAEAHYAAVRARVLSQIAAQQRPWRRWLWAYALAAAALVVFWPRHTPVGQALPPANRPPEQARRAQPPLPASAAPMEHGRRKRLPHPAPALSAAYRVIGPPVMQPLVVKPLVVKLVTNDPNVVIYWISGE